MEASQGRTNNTSSKADNVVQAQNVQGDVHIHGNAGSASAQPVPRQLPAAVRHFINRTVEQDALTTLLSGTGDDPTVLISTIDGLAGVGKSTLVVQWAHHVREQFPDGELYVNLRGFDPAAVPLTPAEALAGFLTALGVPLESVPASEEARAAQFRTLMHGRRMLVVLDNARDDQQVLPLLPGTGCLVVVTSRQRLDGLVGQHGAQRLALTTLTAEEGHQLLTRYLGAERVTTEPDAVDTLLEHCAGLPLALTLVAVQSAAEPDIPLADLAAELGDERDRLDAFDLGGQTGIRAVFSWSYRTLSADAGRMFRLLGLPNSPDIGLWSAAALAGVDQRRARRLLAELCRSHLLTRTAGDRYVFHDLLRAYARERAHADDPPVERTAAIQRLLDHHLYATYAVSHRLAPERDLPELDHIDEELRCDFTTYGEALAWWDAEHINVRATIRQSVLLGLPRGPWLAHAATLPLKLRGLVEEWKANSNEGAQAAQKNGDQLARARLLSDLAVAHNRCGEHESALRCFQTVIELFTELGEHNWVTVTHGSMGTAFLCLGRYQEAADSARRCLQMEDQLDSEVLDPGHADGVLGLALANLGEFSEAFTYLHRAVEVSTPFLGLAYALIDLGSAYFLAGDLDQSVHTHRQALEQSRASGLLSCEATSLTKLGEALNASGDDEGARRSWHEALRIFEQLGHPDAETVREHLNALDLTDR